MFVKILAGLALVLGCLAVIVALQPSTYKVVRSTVVAAAPADVFTQVDNFHNWKAWSPWAKLDPGMKESFEGPASGAGAIYRWKGDKNVGEGNMTILESKPGSRIRIRLEFIKPFASVAETSFDFSPTGINTTVTWTMSGDNGFLSKAFCLVKGGMDGAIGPDFERGLAQMKVVAEARK
jgi:hypothetical protein